jgi:RNA polymerase-binding transcription factor DksA
MVEEQATLLAERRRVQDEIARLRAYLETEMERGGAMGEGSPDYAAETYEREKTLGVIRTLEDTLACIDQAMRAQAAGRYGICECCNERISPERLAVLPQTMLCVRCQLEREARAKRRPSTAGES